MLSGFTRQAVVHFHTTHKLLLCSVREVFQEEDEADELRGRCDEAS